MWELCLNLLVGHFQKLGVDIPRTLPFLVEQELVVAAISTNGCIRKETRVSKFLSIQIPLSHSQFIDVCRSKNVTGVTKRYGKRFLTQQFTPD